MAATDARINERIRAREVRLVGPDGSQIGVKPLPEALHIARELDLDLVEVAPLASPPVCRIMDFGKYKYEQDVRRKESRRKTNNVVIKEMKFRPKIDGHDFATKTKHVERFLAEGAKVKVTIMFRGREVARPELGMRILDRIADQVKVVGAVEVAARIDGRNMIMVLSPVKRPAPPRAVAARPTAVRPEELRSRTTPVSPDGPAGPDAVSVSAGTGEARRPGAAVASPAASRAIPPPPIVRPPVPAAGRAGAPAAPGSPALS